MNSRYPKSGSDGAHLRVISVQHYPEFGGPHNEILKLQPDLLLRGVDTKVVMTNLPGTAAERLAGKVDLELIPLDRVRTARNVRDNVGTALHFRGDINRLRSIIRREEPDVVKVHGPHNPQAAIAANLEGVPVVWVLSSTAPPKAVRSVGMRLVERLADSLLVNGPTLTHFYPRADRLADRSFFFFPPVDTTEFRPPDAAEREEARLALGIPPEATVIGTVANINRQKGIEFFISAAAEVAQQCPTTIFLVAGGVNPAQASYFDVIQRLANDIGLLPNKLRFLGSRTDVPFVLRSFDLKVISSRFEGTTATAGEAMAVGIPVIATDVGAVRDVVQHQRTGLLVPPKNSSALAEAIISLLRNPSLGKAMGLQGRAFANAALSTAVCAETHVNSYKAAIANAAEKRNQGRRKSD